MRNHHLEDSFEFRRDLIRVRNGEGKKNGRDEGGITGTEKI